MTNCEEKGRIKCQQYWPSAGSEVYGRIEVTLLSAVELSHYTVRSFQVKMANLPEERLITQYHYTAWPDHGVPSSVTSVLNFVRKASAANPHEAGPMVRNLCLYEEEWSPSPHYLLGPVFLAII